jgi:hypothetical protein
MSFIKTGMEVTTFLHLSPQVKMMQPGAYFIKIYTAVNKRTALAGNTKGGSITVPLSSCLTGLD